MRLLQPLMTSGSSYWSQKSYRNFFVSLCQDRKSNLGHQKCEYILVGRPARLAGGPKRQGDRMSDLHQFPTLPSQPFRLDVPLHELLQQPSHDPSPRPPVLRKAQTLPEPVFTNYPELCHVLVDEDIAAHDAGVRTGKRHWPASKILKTI